ncbi:MAG: hypothetical protein LBH59_08180, partial [Planctomycetaceae bacterium]|nr:hypothetical protein [Planctomycetaceae bacterium]
ISQYIDNKKKQIKFFISNLKSKNLQEKLYALDHIQWNAEDLFTCDRLTGEEIEFTNSLLECLVGETNVKVIDEILTALRMLTESVYIPKANWEILALEFRHFKTDWLLEQSISLLGKTCNRNYIDLIRSFCASNNQEIVEAATEAIATLELQSQKIKQSNV